MSFILDALKKAESERNRHVAPVLMDARIAPRRRGLPIWAWALGVVLLLNLAALAWLLTRTRAAPAAAPVATTAAPAPDTGAASAPPSNPPAPAAPPAPPASSGADAGAEGTAPVNTPVTAPAATGPSRATNLDDERLPTLQDLRDAGVSLPDLQLNLHVYALAPADRSVMLNGQRVREGEFLPNGIKVERITPQAVILEASQRRFRLVAGE